MSLLNLIQTEDKTQVGTAAYELIDGKVDEPELIASLVSLFNGDIVASMPIVEKLGVKYDNFLRVMAAAVGNSTMMDEIYPVIAKDLQITDPKSIQIITEIT